MSNLEFRVADNADNREVIEASELLRKLTFAREEVFTLVAPRLEIFGVGRVFDKASGRVLLNEVVAADDRSR